MNYKYYDIGQKNIRVAFRSRAFGMNYYNVGIACAAQDCECDMHDENNVTAHFPEDYGLTMDECRQAVTFYVAEQKKECAEYINKCKLV